MKVLKITDQLDGSAIVDLEMSDEEQHIILEYGFCCLLKDQIERMKNEDNLCTTIPE